MLYYILIYYAIIFHPIPHSHLLSILCPLSMNPVYRNTRSGSAVLSIRNSQVSKWAGPGLKYLEGERRRESEEEWEEEEWGVDMG
jgi:hypothetical protein